MDLLTTLGRTMGFSFAAGLNLYATVAILGLASRFDWVSLPPQFKVFDNDIVIGAAIVMYLIEFVADKIPWVDSIWDGVHTVDPADWRRADCGRHARACHPRRFRVLWRCSAARWPPVATSPRPARAPWPTRARSRSPTGSSASAKTLFVVGTGFLALKYPALAALVVLICLALMVIVRRLDRSGGPAPVGGARTITNR